MMNFPVTGAFCCVVSLLAWALLVAGHDKKDEQASSFSEQAQDFEHIKMHLKENLGLDDAAAEKYMKEVEGEIQFFLMNDLNRDSRIDGLEIYKVIAHHHHDHESRSKEHEVPPLEEHDMQRRIDTALKEQDTNGDGYIDYEEFLKHYRPDLHDKALHGAKTSH